MATEIIARFLSDEDIKMIRSISIVTREGHLCLSYEINWGNGNMNAIHTIPFAPNSPVKIDDIILPEQVVFVSIPDKIGKYVWRFGDQFSIDFSPFDSYTSRILRGQLNRDDYFKELEEEKRKKQEKKIKEEEERQKILSQKPSVKDIVIPSLVCLLLISIVFYFGMIEKTETFVWIFIGLLFVLFLIPMIKLCKRIWEKLNVYSIGLCVVLSITLSIFAFRGIDKLVNGEVHVEQFHSSPKNSTSSNNGTIGFDPFPNENVDVYITRYGNCYHCTRNCYEITKSKHISKINKKKAIKRGFVPCSACYGTN